MERNAPVEATLHGWTVVVQQHTDGWWSTMVRPEGADSMAGHTQYCGTSEKMARKRATEFLDAYRPRPAGLPFV